MSDIPGPYMNDDGDWWVAVEDANYRDARDHVVGCLSYDIPFEGTLLYKGREMSTLCTNEEHEVGPDCDASCHRRVLAWHFVEKRRW